MAKTYAELLTTIEELQVRAEAVRRKERDFIVDQIRFAISVYGISQADLGFAATARSKAIGNRKAPARQKAPPVRPRYADLDGNSWGGVGKRPHWLRDALLQGRDLAEFRVA